MPKLKKRCNISVYKRIIMIAIMYFGMPKLISALLCHAGFDLKHESVKEIV